VVEAHAVQQLAGECFLAAEDGADRRAADQMGQAADHAAGALVQVLGLSRQGAGLVAVQPQGGFQRGDQLGPFACVGERAGADQPAPAGELAAAGAGEHSAPFHVDPGIDERGRQVLSEVLQMIRQVLAEGELNDAQLPQLFFPVSTAGPRDIPKSPVPSSPRLVCRCALPRRPQPALMPVECPIECLPRFI